MTLCLSTPTISCLLMACLALCHNSATCLGWASLFSCYLVLPVSHKSNPKCQLLPLYNTLTLSLRPFSAGIQLFGGKLDQKCVTPDTQLVPESESLRLCTQNPSLQRQCPVFNNTQLQCVNTGDNPNGGVTHFDNIGVAFLTLFQCITLEGWVDVMYWVDDTTGASSILYFVLLVVLGSIFLLNLIVAVIVTMLSVEHDLEDKREERDALKEQQKEQVCVVCRPRLVGVSCSS